MTKTDYKKAMEAEHREINRSFENLKVIGRNAMHDSELSLADMGEIMDYLRLIRITDFQRGLTECIFD